MNLIAQALVGFYRDLDKQNLSLKLNFCLSLCCINTILNTLTENPRYIIPIKLLYCEKNLISPSKITYGFT